MSNEINLLTNFDFGGFPVRVVGSFDEPWFIAQDVCDALDISNVSQAVSGLDEDEAGICTAYTSSEGVASDVTPSAPLSQRRELLTVSESGLYALIFKSRKAEAKKFKRWVTHEVLPEIRKTGGYVHDVELFLTHQIMRDLDARSLERVTRNFDQVLRHHVYPKIRSKHGNTSLVEAVLSDTKRELLNYYPDSSGEIKPLPHSRRKSRPSIFIIPGDSVAVLTNAYRMKYKHVDNPLESLEEYIARNGERPVGGVKP